MSAPRVPLRVAVIDTDSGFIRVLSNRMDSAGWQYRILGSAVPPEELVAMKINAVLLDPDAVGEGGWEYLEKVCGLLPDLGVLVAANGATVSQRVRGLRMGADDWISKPCHPEEVIARIESVVRRRRRHSSEQESGPMVVGEIEIRPDQFQAFISGQSLDLTRREFELLQLLGQNEGRVLDREAIYQKVWGYAMAHGDRSVDVFIRKLRTKLEKRSPGYTYIHTHFGVGYRFAAESSMSTAEAVAEVGSDRATESAGAEAPGVPV
ncbi:MAG: response regulator transcription factor [Solirubrobacterales bacterium]|nr:response regulator transcription factor [Solirubrobacterales bacterium]